MDTREAPLWSTVVRGDRTKPTSVRKVPPPDPVGQGSAAELVVTCCAGLRSRRGRETWVNGSLWCLRSWREREQSDERRGQGDTENDHGSTTAAVSTSLRAQLCA